MSDRLSVGRGRVLRRTPRLDKVVEETSNFALKQWRFPPRPEKKRGSDHCISTRQRSVKTFLGHNNAALLRNIGLRWVTGFPPGMTWHEQEGL